ncbi:hypothetical protein NEMBOFW57_003066 [Staphylotrichum longicolle]|uniref:Uncharacterized protein n=1 Tax=Staphylotrichum longicolle TaxID=669026 RepID=A0AAD4F484_9PEZI|nr:hypothetical protein NEMBOFW57_003066 [Staphylotrichum longicolle]
MDDFRFAARLADDATLSQYTTEMCEKFRQGIILGEITPDDTVRLSAEIWETLESRLRGSPLYHQLSLSFCEALMSGLTTSRVFSPSLLDAKYWNILLVQMSKLPADDRLCNLVIEVMHTLPVDCRPHVSDGILSVLGSFVSAWSRSLAAIEGSTIQRLLGISMVGQGVVKQKTLGLLPACLRQAWMIAKALDGGTPEETKALLTAAHRLVVSEATALAEGVGNLRYSWLFVLAHLPQVNQDFLFDAAASLSNPSLNMRPLSGVEICSLLLTQWNSRGYLHASRAVNCSYGQRRGKRDETALVSLFLAVFHNERGTLIWGLYYSAWKFLSILKRADDVVPSLAFAGRTRNLPVEMLETLACTSKDYRIVIQIRDLWSNHLRTKGQRQWNPSIFEMHVKTIVHNPQIPASEIWRVLDIGKLERKGATAHSKIRDHRGTFGHRRADIVEEVSRAFMTAPHLSDRAIFRHVSRAFAFLGLVRGKVPEFVLMDLYRLVTKDLWKQNPGRTKRLLWFLRLVERINGLEMAWSCRLALRRWRARLTRVWLSKGGGGKE